MTNSSLPQPNWPIFDSPSLQEVSEAFLNRRKAITYRGRLYCERIFTESDRGAFEQIILNIDISQSKLKLCIWEDGYLWFGYHIKQNGRNSGWLFLDTFHGDIKDISPTLLVQMVEATLPLHREGQPHGTSELREMLLSIWKWVKPY